MGFSALFSGLICIINHSYVMFSAINPITVVFSDDSVLLYHRRVSGGGTSLLFATAPSFSVAMPVCVL